MTLSRRIQIAVIAAPALVLLVFGIVALRALDRLRQSHVEVEHALVTQQTAEELLARLVDAETAQRGFLLTGDPRFLEPLQGVRPQTASLMSRLRREAASPEEAARVRALGPLVRARLAAVDENVRLRRAGPLPGGGYARLARGKALMDSIRQQLTALQGAQLEQVRARRAQAAEQAHGFAVLLVLGGLVGAACSVAANAVTSRYALERERAARELETANHQLQDQAAELEIQAAELQEHTSELERTAEALASSEARFRGLIEHGSDVISMLQADGTILYHSPSSARVLGHGPEDLLGRSVFEFIHPIDVPRVRAALRGLVSGAKERVVLEYGFRHADRSWRVLETVFSNLLDDPAVASVVANSRDVSERRAAADALRRSEEQLMQAQKMEAVGRLAGGVAHDFNNLLTVIIGNLGMILLHEPEGESAQVLVEVRSAAERAAVLTRRLLGFSRIQAPEPQPVDVNEAVRHSEALLRRLIGADVEVRVALNARDPMVLADPTQMEQVLLNLAVNARDAMPNGGTLTLETQNVRVPAPGGGPTEPRVLIAVTDTGTGMDAETRARIFEPFFTTKERGKGTGLGLSTVYAIVTQSGGHLWVYSEPGMGTTFKVYLPVLENRAARAAEAPAPAAGGSETVLLVEDEDAVRSLVRRALTRAGYRVIEATHPQEAIRLAVAETARIDLLLTDVVMPGMPGPALALRVRSVRPGIRTLYMSGYTGEGLGQLTPLEPEALLLEKPFDPADLLRAVRAALSRSESMA